MNAVTVRGPESDAVAVCNVRIELPGAERRDIRFAANRPLPVAAGPGGASEITFYIDLDYRGPRGR